MIRVLGKELSLHDERGRVIGSWDRDTLTRYLSEGDVDILVTLHYSNNSNWLCPDGTVSVLTRIKNILQEAYSTTPCRVDRNCVTMKLSQFRLDVVPGFRFDDGTYSIPDTYQRRWLKTDPISFAASVTALNKIMGGTFVPIIKMIKGWNREVGWPIRSFHLECIAFSHFRSYTQGYTYDSMLFVFLSKLPNYLALPSYDPVTGERVDGYLDNGATVPDRSKAINKAMRAFAQAKEAFDLQEKSTNLAINKWKALFGEFFPAYG